MRFALDDFGTGYSSLGYLHKYPFGKIKVDRSFVSGINVGKKSEAIIRAVAEHGRRRSTWRSSPRASRRSSRFARCARRAARWARAIYFSRAVPDYLAAMLLAQEQEGVARLTG